MNKTISAAIIFGSLFLSSVTAYAACSTNQCNDPITRLYMVNAGNGDLLVGTAGDESALTNCNAVAGVYLTLEKNSVSFKEIYALLLTAQVTEKSVRLRTEDGSNNCSIQYAFLAS